MLEYSWSVVRSVAISTVMITIIWKQ